MIKRIIEWFALTKSERKILLFLSVTILCGAGIRLFQEVFPSAKRFDYNVSDSTFTALSSIQEDSSAAVAALNGKREVKSKLNINTASKEQLIELPGIGEVTARRIVEYRKEKGRFVTIEDLLAVKGIGRNKLERLRKMISTQ